MDIETLRAKYAVLAPELSERTRRLWAATEARALSYGKIVIDKDGNMEMPYTSGGMYRGWVREDGQLEVTIHEL